MMVGYNFKDATYPQSNAKYNGKTPKDYLSDPETGLRPNETSKPERIAKVYLDNSYTEPKERILPPLEIWHGGVWFEDLEEPIKKEMGYLQEGDKFATWVVSGEATPGNYAYRAYILPVEEAAHTKPRHPLMWPKKSKDSGWKSTTSTKLPAKEKGMGLPFGLRIRCIGCGHWYNQNDVATHVNNCCPATNGNDNDWAMECLCCESLDQTNKLKEGFPKKPPEPKPAETPVEAPASS
jgi:hypothetical protein